MKKLPMPTAGATVMRIPSPDPVTLTTSAFSSLIDAYREYNRIKETETTKREAIRAQRDVALAQIQERKEFLQAYLDKTFDERARVFADTFDILDKGLASDNDKTIGMAMNLLVTQMQANPLAGLREMMGATVLEQLDDPNVDAIDI